MSRWIVGVLLMSALPGQAVEYAVVQAGRSSVGFVSKQMGVPVEGRFRSVAVQLAFDPARPEKAAASIEIDVGSVDAGGPEVNEEVRRKPWFDARTHPVARFVSGTVRTLGGNRYEVTGRMTLKGRTREVSAPFVMRMDGGFAVFEGAFVLKRL